MEVPGALSVHVRGESLLVAALDGPHAAQMVDLDLDQAIAKAPMEVECEGQRDRK